MTKSKANETVVFAWITYKSKAHRNSVNKKVMNDPWIQHPDMAIVSIDHKRMGVGGFKIIVSGKE